MLKDILDQQHGICPYTGQQLVIGENASVDHILPRSRGGSNDPDNLQWVVTQVNLMKHKLNHEEFLALMQEIMTYIDQPSVEINCHD